MRSRKEYLNLIITISEYNAKSPRYQTNQDDDECYDAPDDTTTSFVFFQDLFFFSPIITFLDNYKRLIIV